MQTRLTTKPLVVNQVTRKINEPRFYKFILEKWDRKKISHIVGRENVNRHTNQTVNTESIADFKRR